MQIVEVNISELKPASYNPRKLTDEQEVTLRKSLSEFGFVDPIVVNSNPDRENIIIGGHQRVKVWSGMGNKTVPVFYIDLDLVREKELNIRLNRAVGDWDWDVLKEFFDKDDLMAWGFTENELLQNFGLSSADMVQVDEERMMVITVEAPEAPRIFARQSFYFDSLEEFDMVKAVFKGIKDGKLDTARLVELAKELA